MKLCGGKDVHFICFWLLVSDEMEVLNEPNMPVYFTTDYESTVIPFLFGMSESPPINFLIKLQEIPEHFIMLLHFHVTGEICDEN